MRLRTANNRHRVKYHKAHSIWIEGQFAYPWKKVNIPLTALDRKIGRTEASEFRFYTRYRRVVNASSYEPKVACKGCGDFWRASWIESDGLAPCCH